MRVQYDRIRIYPGELYTCQAKNGICLDNNYNKIRLNFDDYIYYGIEVSHYFDVLKNKKDRWDYVSSQIDIYNKKIDNLFDLLSEGSSCNSKFILYENEVGILPVFDTKQLVMFQYVGVVREDYD